MPYPVDLYQFSTRVSHFSCIWLLYCSLCIARSLVKLQIERVIDFARDNACGSSWAGEVALLMMIIFGSHTGLGAFLDMVYRGSEQIPGI